MKSYFKPGDWNAICDVCGFKFKASQMKQRWDGVMVCHEDWEMRHPMDFLHVQQENTATPWSRPDDSISNLVVCNFVNSQGIAGVAVAGCARAGYINP
jgi:hypothetical protein